jgi:predicted nucleic acid-binding protein
MKHYLLDASAFMILIKKANVQGTIECLQDSSILDLTYYEVGNAIWKESILTKFLTPDDTNALKKVAQVILMKTDRITSEPDSFEKILEIAKIEKLTFYDSSYIHFAKEKGLKLITEDKKLKVKAQKHVNVQTIITLLSPK